MSTNLWHRATTAVRDRYQGSALAQYGAGLHTECDDCGTGPADVAVPTPRGHAVDPARTDAVGSAR